MWTMRMSLAEYRSALRDMMALQLRYAVSLVQRRQMPFGEAVGRHTELYAYCDLYDPTLDSAGHDGFRDLVRELDRLRGRVGNEAFPQQAWPLIAPHLEPRLASDLAAGQEQIARSFYGFSYEFCPEYFGPGCPVFLTLHFRNYFGPGTPFDHRQELVAGLKRLLDEAHASRPDVEQVQCATWLNNLPVFTDLFPAEWLARSNDCPYEANAGWWGQFIDRTGQLDHRKAAAFLKAGVFRCPNRHSRCSRTALLAHLDALRDRPEA